jgi:hypothetical protein
MEIMGTDLFIPILPIAFAGLKALNGCPVESEIYNFIFF